MSNDRAKPYINHKKRQVGYVIKCPGCGFRHLFNVEEPGGSTGDQTWEFNGDLERPTFSPSLLVRWQEKGVDKCCHSFVRDGKIQFLNDCTHDLAGKTVNLEPIA